MFAELTDMGSWKLLNKSLYNIFRNFHAEEKRNCNFWKGKGLSFFVDNWASIIITVIRLADWLVVGFNSNCLLVGPGAIGGIPSLGVFLRDPCSYLRDTRVSEKNHGKFRTARSRNKPVASCLPVLNATTNLGLTVWHLCLTQDSNPGT